MNREKEIIDKILKLMQHIERFSNYTGQEKKAYVLRNMKQFLGEAEYEVAKMFLSMIVEVVIGFSHGLSVDVNREKIDRCCCWLLH